MTVRDMQTDIGCSPLTLQSDRFFCDPDYLALVEMHREQRLLFITDMSETRVSAFLAWLFRPYEGHGLGERAIRELLLNAWRKAEQTDSVGHTLPSPGEINNWSFRDLLVETEYQVEKNLTDSKGRGRSVDLLIVSHWHKLMICIENKFGSVAHSNQLRDYRQSLEKKFDGYKKVFIYLDWNAENEADDTGWIQLDYLWLISLISAQEESGLLSDQALGALKQVREYLGEEAAMGDDQQTRKDNLISSLVKKHREVIQVFSHYKSTDWNSRFEKPQSLNHSLMIEFHQRWSLWHEVIDQSHHAGLVSDVKNATSEELEISASPAGVTFRLKKWSAYDPVTVGYWGARVWAWTGRDQTEQYEVGAGVQLDRILDEKQDQLRTAAVKLRSLTRAAPKKASWIKIYQASDLKSDAAAQNVVAVLKRMEKEFSEII